MRKKVEFELLSPLMTGGIRIADNFLESESFIRGSVLRAAFANEILLECPLADVPGKNGELNFIEEKEPDGKCQDCPNRNICRAFSNMYFSFAYPADSIPAPLTAKVCKTAGLRHRIQDTVVQNGRLQCPDCQAGLKRMESLKGLIRQEIDAYSSVRIHSVLTTHTAINYDTHIADDGKLFTIKAIPRGLIYTAEIDDCDTGFLCTGKVIHVGKYASAGYGKLRIKSISDAQIFTTDQTADDIRAFQNALQAPNQAALLFRSDAILDIPADHAILPDEEYLRIWQNALFGSKDSVTVEKVYAETQLYSGYNTARKWGEWKDKQPILLVKKGTSVLLHITEGAEQQAYATLTNIAENGIGQRTKDGFGSVSVCHPLHRLGVYQNVENN